MSLSTTRLALRTVQPHFQRSINLAYDVGNADYITGYIPTPNGASALAAILENTEPDSRQRAHVLQAAYGSGKSLVGLVLSALASDHPDCQEALSIVLKRLKSTYSDQADRINAYRDSRRRLLPVILTGDEGYLSTALTRALGRTLAQHNLHELQPRTQFQAALETIRLWEQNYPDTHQRLQATLTAEGSSLQVLFRDLDAMLPEALALFERLYPGLTAGARFDRFAGPTLNEVFQATAEELHTFGYTGILVIWDEFGRYLDARAEDAFRAEAALLQSFAEFCNRSGAHQVHLVLITHRILSGYAASLPLSYQQEWARIAERFRTHDVSSDPATSYQLLAQALDIPDTLIWERYLGRYRSAFDQLTARSLELNLFNELDDVILRQQIVERAWPLHPLAVYALPRLANQVAQNERTLFTFLASDESGALAQHFQVHLDGDEWWLVGLDVIWDYFAEAIRSDTRSGNDGAHPVWSGVVYALDKLDPDDVIGSALIKALGVLLIVSEVTEQALAAYGRVLPTTEVLAWALGISEKDATTHLETLARRRAVIFRRADGYWTFTRGSDIDLDAELRAVLERRTPTRLQIRQLLERDFPPPFSLPRRYNLERHINRFFWGLYRWPDELNGLYTEAFLKQLGPHGYADGAIVYVLVADPAEREQALTTINNLPQGRIVFVVPDQPLLILEPLRELFGLRELSANAAFMQQDERLMGEVTFFIEDAQRRLLRSLRPLLEPHHSSATWWSPVGSTWRADRLQTADISRLLSQLCTQWFSETPILNNEPLNQQEPFGPQVRAAENVVDALLAHPPDVIPPDLGISGQGPDFLIARTLLVRTGLVQLTDNGYWHLVQPPSSSPLGRIWDTVRKFLDTALESKQEIGILLDTLQSPPFGLRRGVLPVLLAAIIREHLPVLTIRQNRQVISPITGQVFTALCEHPEQYTIEVGPWDARRADLWVVLEEFCQGFLSEQERAEQPINFLSIGLLRWLQVQPRYSRETNQISPAAQQLRELIRKAQRDPAQVLLYEFLDLLDDGSLSHAGAGTYRMALGDRLSNLAGEITTAYQALLYLLDRFASATFAGDTLTQQRDGPGALRQWLIQLGQRSGHPLQTLRFSDQLAQRFIEAIQQNPEIQGDRFWNQLSQALLGISLYDWNDRSIQTFKHSCLEVKERVERELLELAEDEAVVELHVSLPAQSERTYRFRPSALSPQGERILQNFKSTLEIAGRPLSPDEKRQVVLALLSFVLEGSRPDDEQPGATRRRRR